MKNEKYYKLSLLTLVLVVVATLILGFVIGSFTVKHLEFSKKLSIDGIVSMGTGLLAVIAATLILPLSIQPAIKKQGAVNKVCLDDLKSLAKNIQDTIELLTVLNSKKISVNDATRKIILANYKKISGLATLINSQRKSIDGLKKFTKNVYTPLTDAHTSFSDKVVPGVKMDDEIFLQVKNQLDVILYHIQEIRYKIN